MKRVLSMLLVLLMCLSLLPVAVLASDEPEAEIEAVESVEVIEEEPAEIAESIEAEAEPVEVADEAANEEIGIPIDEEHFPDANFRDYVSRRCDADDDDILTDSEIAAVTSIDCWGDEIASLKGIEYFSSLTDLSCDGNQLTALDVSKNASLKSLLCHGNQLTSLDVSKNTALTILWCGINQLTELDVSGCTELTQLYCSRNLLASLNLSGCSALQYLNCTENDLSNLDLSSCSALIGLVCDSNRIATLDISKCADISSLWCNDNQLSSLDVSKCVNLYQLSCVRNKLSQLDISNCPRLLECMQFDPEVSDSTIVYGSNDGWSPCVAVDTSVTLIAQNVQPLSAPTVTLSTVASSGKIKISWNAVEGAEKYEVWRATSKSGTYSRITTTSKLTVTNTKNTEAGTTYYYKVKAIGGEGYTDSEFSAIKYITCDCARPVVTLTNVASSGKIKVSWKAVDGAVSYTVYRATSKNGEYTKMLTTEKTYYTNTSAVAGKTYYYYVVANGSKSAADSAASEIKSRTCDCKQPTVTIQLSSKGKPYLKWAKVTGAQSYTVYRATSQSGQYTKLITTTKLYTVNTSAVKGKTYYYKVVANGSSKYANSAYSEVVNIQSK